MSEENFFDEFTNLYSVTKTLRFELKPVGETLENMKKHLEYDEDLQTFLKDQRIEDAYKALKPIFDKIHEDFITVSLESSEAKEINFVKYFEGYSEGSREGEVELRKEIGKLYHVGEDYLKSKSPRTKKGDKGILTGKGAQCMMGKSILQYIIYNASDFTEILSVPEIKENVEIFSGFFTYFKGFNENRTNYYEIKDGKATAIATRIVHENLPKFCDNAIQFEFIIKKKKDGTIEKISRQAEYTEAYQYLKNLGVTTQVKDAHTGKFIELSPIIGTVFDINYFNGCLSQSGIDEYNRIIGHYNALINLYNQAKKNEDKDFKKLPVFKTLYKQIGCGKKKSLFFKLTHDYKKDADENKEDYAEPYSIEQLLENIIEAGNLHFEQQEDSSGNEEVQSIPQFLTFILGKDSYEGVYWSKVAVNTVFNRYIANLGDLHTMLLDRKVFKRKGDNDVQIPEVVELSELFKVIDTVENWQNVFFKESLTVIDGLQDENEIQKRKVRAKIISESSSPSEALLRMVFQDMHHNMQYFLNNASSILELQDYRSEEGIKKIKLWMDHARYTIQMLKYFYIRENKIKKGGSPLDSKISNTLKYLLFESQLKDGSEVNWFQWYDALRNYLTKKPQDDVQNNKLKLNFDKGNLLGGFVDSHTSNSDNATQYGGYLFRKYVPETNKYDYLIGISKDAKLFRCHLKNQVLAVDKSDIQRLEYYQPKSTTFFSSEYSRNKEKLVTYLSKQVASTFDEIKKVIPQEDIKELERCNQRLLKKDTPTALISAIRKERKYTQYKDIFVEQDFLSLLSETILEIRSYIQNYETRIPLLKDLQEKEYTSELGLKDLIDDLQEIAKKSRVYEYFPVNLGEFEEACSRDDNPLFMFEITNKDLAKRVGKEGGKVEQGKKNLHTLYFESLFSGEQATIDLGKGSVFYRTSGIDCKDIKKGYEGKPWVIHGKRFTKNSELEEGGGSSVFDGKSFFLHLSAFFNYSSIKGFEKGRPNPPAISIITEKVTKYVLSEDEVYFLGLDRGEKHLVYYSLVDQRGNIVKQGSFNEINGHNYLEKLIEKEKNRDEARKNWQTIENIKNLKEGYISQVIHEICKIVQDKPTFIVLEDLNTGFKRGRQKIERQIYQKFELALAKKLNYLVNKNAEYGEVGSATKALQLTPPVQNYGDIEYKKQVGIMLYTRANYTSITDPLTGWRKSIYLQRGSVEKVKRAILEGFDDIGFQKGHYFFEYTHKKTGRKIRLWSGHNGEELLRYRGRRNAKHIWTIERVKIEEILDKLFSEFDKTISLKEQLLDGLPLQRADEGYTAWESLRFVIDLIQQIRNSGDVSRGEDDNFLLSPVRDDNGEYYDSRRYRDQNNSEFPKDADANGAYNIARKGILMAAHIKEWVNNGMPKEGNVSDLDLFISDAEWDLWLHDKEDWNKQLEWFSSEKLKKSE